MGRLDGKVALVTGAARGMGATHSRRFAAEGATVVVTDVLEPEGEALVEELGSACRFIQLDVSSEEQWETAVNAVVDQYGRIDVLVNNAGVLRMTPMVSLTLDEYMHHVEVNQIGVFLGMRSVASAMCAAGRGSIINVSSVGGLVGAIDHVAYCATKWAVRGMTKAAALELAQFGVRVNSIHPGAIETPMMKQHQEVWGTTVEDFARHIPLRRVGNTVEVANLALFLASDESSHCTGSEFIVDGGMTAGDGTW